MFICILSQFKIFLQEYGSHDSFISPICVEHYTYSEWCILYYKTALSKYLRFSWVTWGTFFFELQIYLSVPISFFKICNTGHAGTKACVLHGGLNGIYEAIYNAVPMLIIPAAFDAPDNAVRVVDKGMGLHISPQAVVSRDIHGSITRLITENR